MKNDKMKKSLLSVFVILVTAGIFLILNKDILDTGMCWFAFSVIMASEIVLALLWVNFNGNPQKFAAVTISILQTVANIIVSSIFVAFFSEAYVGFAVYTAVSFAALVIFDFFFFRASAVTEKTADAKDFFKGCRATVNALALSQSGKAYAKELSKLEENIRFCNDGKMVAGDNEIYDAIQSLEAKVKNGEDGVLDAIEEINALLKKHDFMAK